jgi:hypothetical protein
MSVDFNHPLVGRVAVYRDPFRDAPEQGPITSVNVDAGIVFVRFSQGSTSAGCATDERLALLDGKLVRSALHQPTEAGSPRTGENNG